MFDIYIFWKRIYIYYVKIQSWIVRAEEAWWFSRVDIFVLPFLQANFLACVASCFPFHFLSLWIMILNDLISRCPFYSFLSSLDTYYTYLYATICYKPSFGLNEYVLNHNIVTWIYIYMCVCVCVCVCARARACVCVCVCVYVYTRSASSYYICM